jgi:hypothetical protein
VRGVVKERKSIKEENGKVYAHTTVKVEEWLKGKGEKEIVIRQVGGVTGEETKRPNGDVIFATVLHQGVVGDAGLALNEEVILFLLKKGDSFVINGLADGKYGLRITKHGERIVVQDTGGINYVKKDSETGRLFKIKEEVAVSPTESQVFESIITDEPTEYKKALLESVFIEQIKKAVEADKARQ